VRITRQAISPRLATSTLSNSCGAAQRVDRQQLASHLALFSKLIIEVVANLLGLPGGEGAVEGANAHLRKHLLLASQKKKN
jgi:hypothetical protein